VPVLDIGVSRSTGLTCYWGLSQVLTLGFYAREGGATRTTPEVMLRQIEDTRMRETSGTVSLNRKIVLIVEGSREYLMEWMITVARVDMRIFVGSVEDLESLGLPVIDKTWNSRRRKINLNEYVRQLDGTS